MTVTTASRGTVPAEVLAVGPPAPCPPRLPVRLRALLAAALVVLGAGVVTALQQEPAGVRPPAVPASVAGVTATARLEREQPGSVRLALRVVVAVEESGRGDTNGPDEPEQLRLVAVAARGFRTRVVERSLPLRLADVGRYGSGLRQVVPLGLDVVVGDCAVDPRAPRTLTLRLQREAAPAGAVVVATGPEVVRALDDLVRRACRRPRG